MSYSIAISRPCTVSAQMTVTSIAIKTSDQIGYNGIHAKLTSALTAARPRQPSAPTRRR